MNITMTSPEVSNTCAMPDVQSSIDHRNIVIDRVGIRGVRHPIQVKTDDGVMPSVAVIDLDVSLPGDQKGNAHVAFYRPIARS